MASTASQVMELLRDEGGQLPPPPTIPSQQPVRACASTTATVLSPPTQLPLASSSSSSSRMALLHHATQSRPTTHAQAHPTRNRIAASMGDTGNSNVISNTCSVRDSQVHLRIQPFTGHATAAVATTDGDATTTVPQLEINENGPFFPCMVSTASSWDAIKKAMIQNVLLNWESSSQSQPWRATKYCYYYATRVVAMSSSSCDSQGHGPDSNKQSQQTAAHHPHHGRLHPIRNKTDFLHAIQQQRMAQSSILHNDTTTNTTTTTTTTSPLAHVRKEEKDTTYVSLDILVTRQPIPIPNSKSSYASDVIVVECKNESANNTIQNHNYNWNSTTNSTTTNNYNYNYNTDDINTNTEPTSTTVAMTEIDMVEALMGLRKSSHDTKPSIVQNHPPPHTQQEHDEQQQQQEFKEQQPQNSWNAWQETTKPAAAAVTTPTTTTKTTTTTTPTTADTSMSMECSPEELSIQQSWQVVRERWKQDEQLKKQQRQRQRQQQQQLQQQKQYDKNKKEVQKRKMSIRTVEAMVAKKPADMKVPLPQWEPGSIAQQQQQLLSLTPLTRSIAEVGTQGGNQYPTHVRSTWGVQQPDTIVSDRRYAEHNEVVHDNNTTIPNQIKMMTDKANEIQVRPSHSVDEQSPRSDGSPTTPSTTTSSSNQDTSTTIKVTSKTHGSLILPVLNPYDVLCSRSKVAFKAIGNRRLRILMELTAPRYERTQRKIEKTNIVASIVEIVQRAGGKFIRRNRTTGDWEEAPNEIAKEKVGHGLRDAVGNQGRSIYDVLGHEYFSKVSLKAKAGEKLLEAVARKATNLCTDVCTDTPTPTSPVSTPAVLAPPAPTPPVSILKNPKYQHTVIAASGEAQVPNYAEGTRKSAGPLKKRRLSSLLEPVRQIQSVTEMGHQGGTHVGIGQGHQMSVVSYHESKEGIPI